MTPTFSHGKNTKILVDGVDVSEWFKTWDAKRDIATAETSTIGNEAKTYIPGLGDGTFSLDGYADGSSGGIDGILNGAYGGTSVITCVSTLDAIGAPAVCAQVDETSLETSADVSSAVTLKLSGQATGGIDGCTVYHNLQQETSGGSETSINNGGSSANGASSYLHVTAVGTTVTVKLQNSSDNSTWVDLIDHTAVTSAPGFEKLYVAGTVLEYTRCLWTQTGDVTFHHAVVRH